MAGAGYKLFNTGDVLTAAQVNTYLMEQTVMVFADAAARTTALTGVVSEGMISYLKDTNAVEVYNGSAWVASDDPNAIQNTIVNAKGDIIGASANDTPAITSVGSNGEYLVADSGTSTGLRWQSTNTGNFAINGAFDWWQRGTSFTAANEYTADRWRKDAQTTSTLSRQTSGLTQFNYCARSQRNNGQTNTTAMGLISSLETIQFLPLAGQTVVLSFYARAGANYSASSSGLGVILYTGTGTDQARTFTATYTGEATPISTTATLTTSWQRFQFTATLSSSATEGAITFYYAPVGTAGAADYFEVTGVQLEVGSIATAFKRSGGTLQGELGACQRYYQVFTRDNFALVGSAYSTSAAAATPQFFFPMRGAPTITLATAGSGTGQMTFLTSAAAVPGTIGAFAAENITASGFRLTGTGFTSAFTAGNSTLLFCGSSAVDVWRASAEL